MCRPKQSFSSARPRYDDTNTTTNTNQIEMETPNAASLEMIAAGSHYNGADTWNEKSDFPPQQPVHNAGQAPPPFAFQQTSTYPPPRDTSADSYPPQQATSISLYPPPPNNSAPLYPPEPRAADDEAPPTYLEVVKDEGRNSYA